MKKRIQLALSLSLTACAAPQSIEGAAPAHETLRIEGPYRLRPGENWSSEWLAAPFPFDELLPSWNISVPEGASFRVEVMVADETPESASPWLDLGGWGDWPAAKRAAIEFDGGRVEVDLVKLDQPVTRWRWRIETRGAGEAELVLAWSAIRACFTNGGALAGVDAGPEPDGGRVEVSLRRQYDEAPELASRICSPTSVAMVLDYHGVDRSTAEIAALLYDHEHDIYGNWNRAVQGAWTFHVPGYLTRISTWAEAAQHIEDGRPLVISIGVEEGQLTGAPYRRTDGHLVVLCGFDGAGRALVMDPAVPAGDEGPRRYALAELETTWLRRGGFTYVLCQPKRMGHLGGGDPGTVRMIPPQ